MLGTDNMQALERIDGSEFSQKAHLLHALLAIGCIGPAIHLLSLHPYISGPYPSISDGIHRLLHVAIDSIYAPHSPGRSFGEDVLAALNARKRRAIVNRSAPGSFEWLHEVEFKTVRGYDPFPKQELSDRRVRFFLEDELWKDEIPICETIDDFFTVVGNLIKFSGPRLGKDVSLMVKLCRVGKAQFAKVSQLHVSLMV